MSPLPDDITVDSTAVEEQHQINALQMNTAMEDDPAEDILSAISGTENVLQVASDELDAYTDKHLNKQKDSSKRRSKIVLSTELESEFLILWNKIEAAQGETFVHIAVKLDSSAVGHWTLASE